VSDGVSRDVDDDLGDLKGRKLRDALRWAAERAADYLDGGAEAYPVLPRLAPGDVRAALAATPPLEGEPLEAVFADYERVIEPNVTHWNHPGFLAYFAITGSAVGVAAETLAAALNVNAMLWRTGPAAVEVEAEAAVRRAPRPSPISRTTTARSRSWRSTRLRRPSCIGATKKSAPPG